MLYYLIWYGCYVAAIILGICFRKLCKVFLVMGIVKLARLIVVLFLTATTWKMYASGAFDDYTIASALQNNIKTLIGCAVCGIIFLVLWRVCRKKYPDTPMHISGGRKAVFIISLALFLVFAYVCAGCADTYSYIVSHYEETVEYRGKMEADFNRLNAKRSLAQTLEAAAVFGGISLLTAVLRGKKAEKSDS